MRQLPRTIWLGVALALAVLLAASGPLGAVTAAPVATETPLATTEPAPTEMPAAATPEAAPAATVEPADPEAPIETAQPNDPEAEGVTFQEEDDQEEVQNGQGPEPGKRRIDNVVQVLNKKEGGMRMRGNIQLNRIYSSTVDPINLALGFSSCVDCRTFAVALQINLIARGATYVAPQNVAVAANVECDNCYTVARAIQYTFSVDDPNNTPPEVSKLIKDLNKELKAIHADKKLTIPEAETRIDAVLTRFHALAQSLRQTRDQTAEFTDPDAPPEPTAEPTAAPSGEPSTEPAADPSSDPAGEPPADTTEPGPATTDPTGGEPAAPEATPQPESTPEPVAMAWH